MENIINKLDKIKDNDINVWNNWSLEEIKKLLDIYYIISKKETHIFELIYNNHGCDSYEDIFRDYDYKYFEDKTTGVKIAIDEIVRSIKKSNVKKSK